MQCARQPVLGVSWPHASAPIVAWTQDEVVAFGPDAPDRARRFAVGGEFGGGAFRAVADGVELLEVPGSRVVRYGPGAHVVTSGLGRQIMVAAGDTAGWLGLAENADQPPMLIRVGRNGAVRQVASLPADFGRASTVWHSRLPLRAD